jgi:hypothetical protein
MANDLEILQSIVEVSEEKWFQEGLDCENKELLAKLEECEASEPALQELVQLVVQGPGTTDVHIATGTPISELLEEGYTEEHIYDENTAEFAEQRMYYLQKSKSCIA